MFGLSRYERARKAHPLATFLPAQGLDLLGHGPKRKARCPWHPHDDTPSLSIDLDKDLWHCFACAQIPGSIAGGCSIEWLMRKDSISKKEAVHRMLVAAHGEDLRVRVGPHVQRGVPATPASPAAPPPALAAAISESPPQPISTELAERVAEIYHADLARSSDAQSYLVRRGLGDAELVRRFRIGYASGRLLSLVAKTGGTLDDLVRLGVVTRRGESLRELMTGCVVFPIPVGAEPDSPTVSFYARRTTDDEPRHLYPVGGHRGVWNAAATKASDTVLLTEAIVDALSAWLLGYPSAIALYGTNGLTADHVALLREAAECGRLREIVLAVDNDAGGDGAAGSLPALLAQRLGAALPRISRIHVPKLPGVKDVNEFLVKSPGTLDEKRRAFAALFEAREVLREPSVPPARPAAPPKAAPGTPETANRPPATPDAAVEVRSRGIEIAFPAGPNGTPSRVYVARPGPGILPDRLRVLLSARVGTATHLDQVDLYSARARTAFASKLAKLSGLPADALEAELLGVVAEVERHVESRTEHEEGKKNAPPPMSPAEREEALRFLADPRLLERILADMEECGYVGERENRLIGYCVGVSRKDRFPLSAVVLSQSGAGKSALAETVEKLTPPEDVMLFSRLTPQALYYLERRALAHKLVIIEERHGAAAADYPIRILQSRQSLTQAVPVKDPSSGNIRTKILTVDGPIAYLETTTDAAIHPENATRCFELYLDESREQTARIYEAQKRAKRESQEARAQRIEAIRRRHHNAQRLLEPIEARIPFADFLRFPADTLRGRRDHPRFLNLIAAITFLHQRQRPVKEDSTGRYLEATLADYRVAHDLARVVLGSSLAELSKPLRTFLDGLAGLAANGEGFTRRDIRRHTNLPDHRVRMLLNELIGLEYVEAVEGKQGQKYRYRLSEAVIEESRIVGGLTPPDELERKLAGPGLPQNGTQRSPTVTAG